jgi:hypothetical protein
MIWARLHAWWVSVGWGEPAWIKLALGWNTPSVMRFCLLALEERGEEGGLWGGGGVDVALVVVFWDVLGEHVVPLKVMPQYCGELRVGFEH